MRFPARVCTRGLGPATDLSERLAAFRFAGVRRRGYHGMATREVVGAWESLVGICETLQIKEGAPGRITAVDRDVH